jgi:hypothetical protein
MELTDLVSELRHLTSSDLDRVATSLRSDTVGDEVDAWRATIAIDRALRHAHRSRQGAQAAWDAAQAVQQAAAGNGVALPNHDVTLVARAAAEVARGIVAGDEAACEVSRLLVHWFPVFARA